VVVDRDSVVVDRDSAEWTRLEKTDTAVELEENRRKRKSLEDLGFLEELRVVIEAYMSRILH